MRVDRLTRQEFSAIMVVSCLVSLVVLIVLAVAFKMVGVQL